MFIYLIENYKFVLQFVSKLLSTVQITKPIFHFSLLKVIYKNVNVNSKFIDIMASILKL